MELYLSRINAQGAILLHVTNVHLKLEPVVDRLARDLGVSVTALRNDGDGWAALFSRWMLVTKDPTLPSVPAIAERSHLPEQLPIRAPLWTDDHAGFMPVIK